MNRAGTFTAPREAAATSNLAALLRPRLSMMAVLSGVVGAFLADPALGSPWRLFFATAGIALATAGGSVLNQLLERRTDALMERTADRPLVTGAWSPTSAGWLGGALSVAGVAVLWAVAPVAGALCVAALVLYLAAYTPLKRVSTLNTVVGAIPGALPPVMGWAAMTGGLSNEALLLFGIVFLWQFPHFMAIAWLHRDDYRRAGLVMLSLHDEDGAAAGRQALVYACALLPVTLFLVPGGMAGTAYFAGALVLGTLYVLAAGRFARRRTHSTAKGLLLASVAHLGLLLTFMALDARTGALDWTLR